MRKKRISMDKIREIIRLNQELKKYAMLKHWEELENPKKLVTLLYD